MTRSKLQSMGLLHGPGRFEKAPQPAARDIVERFHRPEYLRILERASRREVDTRSLNAGLGTADCPVFDHLLDYALLAAGATMEAAHLLLNGSAAVAVNFSGGFHHAHAERAGGFCYLNDIVLACLLLSDAGKRVVFLDLDVHHCDGVQAAFYQREDVMTVSLHEDGRHLFPGTGAVEDIGSGAGRGYSVNVPLPPGTYDEAYRRAYRQIVEPLLSVVRPDVLVVEVGADVLAGDPLADLACTNNVHADIVRSLMGLRLPLLVTGGGGYHIENTVREWALVWSVICGEDPDEDVTAGMGGVLLESTEWQGGLRDRRLAVAKDKRDEVDRELSKTIAAVRKHVFPVHRL